MEILVCPCVEKRSPAITCCPLLNTKRNLILEFSATSDLHRASKHLHHTFHVYPREEKAAGEPRQRHRRKPGKSFRNLLKLVHVKISIHLPHLENWLYWRPSENWCKTHKHETIYQRRWLYSEARKLEKFFILYLWSLNGRHLQYKAIAQMPWKANTYIFCSFLHDVTEQNKMVRLHGDGAITYGMRFTTTLACMMDLHYYPLDQWVASMIMKMNWSFALHNQSGPPNRPIPFKTHVWLVRFPLLKSGGDPAYVWYPRREQKTWWFGPIGP